MLDLNNLVRKNGAPVGRPLVRPGPQSGPHAVDDRQRIDIDWRFRRSSVVDGGGGPEWRVVCSGRQTVRVYTSFGFVPLHNFKAISECPNIPQRGV